MSDLKIFTDNIDEKASEQIQTLIRQPAFSNCKVRIMPDVHAGAGCVIGFTADLGDKIIPNIVGVDIGCGMYTVPLGQIDIDFDRLDTVIRDRVPAGTNAHDSDLYPRYAYNAASRYVDQLYCVDKLREQLWIKLSMGTLGGGNHFIEIDTDEDGNKYLIVHTGSRNLGKQVADIYQKMAINSIYSNKDRKNELCYLTGKDRDDYLHDMKVCQKYAEFNRMVIACEILNGMDWIFIDSPFHTVHNYINDNNMVRKGAISAMTGERVLIPINMRDGCILGIGKGNPDWNYSAPHGAGRIMSRTEAKKLVSMDEYRSAMDGIFTTSVDESTIDESPMAYKSMDEITSNIFPTVDIQKIIKPIYNFKAGE